MEKKWICYECGNSKDIELKKLIRRYEGDGYGFDLKVEIPVCNNCGNEIYDEEIEDKIREKANRIIREKKNIITCDEIKRILIKYNVSQKTLSKLLGWGEITLTRYITKNYTPNKENSDLLKEIENPYIFLKYINKELQNENSSIDKKLIIKSQKEVNNLLTKMENENGKIYKVINWFLKESNEENPITHLSLQKSLYFVQSWSKIINDQWIFNDDCQAWIHGAVYPNIYEIFKNFKYDHLPQISKEIDLDEREIKLLKLVKKYYTDVYTPRTLENICHKEKPYKLARIGKNIDERSNEIIEKDNIEKYYKDISYKYHITSNSFDGIKQYLVDIL